jgi:hypothetical protein
MTSAKPKLGIIISTKFYLEKWKRQLLIVSLVSTETATVHQQHGYQE